MEQWIRHVLSSDSFGLAFFPAVFLIGVLGSLSSCCTLPVIGAVVGYAGSRVKRSDRRELLLVGLFFMIGTTIALAVIGALSGLVSQVASSMVGKYWQFASGLLIVVFGLVSLNLIHIQTPKFSMEQWVYGNGVSGAILYGLVLGGASTACSVGCNPRLPIAIGATFLNGTALMGAVTLTIFAIGYSLPLAAGLVGIGLGLARLNSAAQRAMPYVRIGAGILLIAVGFYLLASI